MPSRQFQAQKALVDAGKCGGCGGKRPKGSGWYCDPCGRKCAIRHRKRKGCLPWLPGARGRPPKWYQAAVRKQGRDSADARAKRLHEHALAQRRMEQA